MPTLEGKPFYQVIRTRITESTLPNQVMEFATTESEYMAQTVAALWECLPNVKAGRETIRIVAR